MSTCEERARPAPCGGGPKSHRSRKHLSPRTRDEAASRSRCRRRGGTGNALLKDWETPFAAPPFAEIGPDDFRPAFDSRWPSSGRRSTALPAARRSRASTTPSTRWSCSGRKLRRVSAVFFNLTGAHTNEALQKIERDMAPRARRSTGAPSISTSASSAASTRSKPARGALGLTPEQARVLERYHISFVRHGAGLDPDGKKRLAAITERLGVARHEIRPERARRREGLCAGARRRGGSRRPARFRCAKRRRRRPPSAACRASTSSRCRAR